MKICETIPVAGCVRHVEIIILELSTATAGQVVAQWEDCHGRGGKEIIIRGLFVGSTGIRAIRWDCPALAKKGLFGRGLAGYDRMELPAWADTLPIVK